MRCIDSPPPGNRPSIVEIFGPILPIVRVENLSEAVEFIRQRECPLAVYLFTEDETSVQRVLKETLSGAVTVNDVAMHMCRELRLIQAMCSCS